MAGGVNMVWPVTWVCLGRASEDRFYVDADTNGLACLLARLFLLANVPEQMSYQFWFIVCDVVDWIGTLCYIV